MEWQQVTITLPETIYQRLKRKSQLMQRSVADELVAVVTASLPEEETLPADIEQELSDLELFTDEELWRAARMTAPADKTERMQVLVEKQQLEGLTDAEKQEAAVLSHYVSLDAAVLDAYWWPHMLTDEQILERLLALNLEWAKGD